MALTQPLIINEKIGNDTLVREKINGKTWLGLKIEVFI